MAEHYAVIPSSIKARRVFDAINQEAVEGMPGLIVTADGSERIGDFFSSDRDTIYKSCVDKFEIIDKLRAGATIGYLIISHPAWQLTLARTARKTHEADVSAQSPDCYQAMVKLFNSSKEDQSFRQSEYDKWLLPLQSLPTNRRFTTSYGDTMDLLMHYRLPTGSIKHLIERIDLLHPQCVVSGQVQEIEPLRKFDLDLKGHGFRSLYSVYSEWPISTLANYPMDDLDRFCSAIDKNYNDVLVSVGRAYLSYLTKTGKVTRTLAGNRFQVYNTKTRRSVCVRFEQYADEDPPVRDFSGPIRSNLAALGIKI